MSEHDIEIPERADGTAKAFWYDRVGDHVIHRFPDGSMEAIGWQCKHPVEVLHD